MRNSANVIMNFGTDKIIFKITTVRNKGAKNPNKMSIA